MSKLADIAHVVRSKNAGPFMLTFDVLFKTVADFERAQASGVFAREALAARLGYPADTMRVVFYPPGWAIKITVPRSHPSGSIDDTDVFGCQQHAPLLDADIA